MTDYPWPEDDEALREAVIVGGSALADAMGWHVTRADYAMARIVLVGGRDALEAPLRAEVERRQSQIDDTRRILRLECAQYEDNDWPDDLHLADVVEKHLARSAHREVARLEAESHVLTASLRAANNTTQAEQGRAERAEALFRERQGRPQ